MAAGRRDAPVAREASWREAGAARRALLDRRVAGKAVPVDQFAPGGARIRRRVEPPGDRSPPGYAAIDCGTSASTASSARSTFVAVATVALRPISPIRHIGGASGPRPP